MPARAISTAGLEKLKRYDFPGNIRELRNLIERALILSIGSEIGHDFPLPPIHGNEDDLHWIASLPEAVNL